jgi:hypothetical protein
VTESTGKIEKLNAEPVTEWSFIDQHPVNGEKYTYYVTAVSSSDESAHSNPAPVPLKILAA